MCRPIQGSTDNGGHQSTITAFIIIIIIIVIIIRVRDEFRLTLHAAETLYESSIAFGNRSELIMMSMLVVQMMMMLLLTELQNVKIIHE